MNHKGWQKGRFGAYARPAPSWSSHSQEHGARGQALSPYVDAPAGPWGHQQQQHQQQKQQQQSWVAKGSGAQEWEGWNEGSREDGEEHRQDEKEEWGEEEDWQEDGESVYGVASGAGGSWAGGGKMSGPGCGGTGAVAGVGAGGKGEAKVYGGVIRGCGRVAATTAGFSVGVAKGDTAKGDSSLGGLLRPSQGMLRPATAAVSATSVAAIPGQRHWASRRYMVYTEGEDGEESVIQTLSGEFFEKTSNHGRPTYQKASEVAGEKPLEVFLYYWDDREGAEFEGWWFGRAVGGDEVWAHNSSKDMTPPRRGWRIPYTGDVRLTFVVISKAEQQQQQQQQHQGPRPPARPPPASVVSSTCGVTVDVSKENLEQISDIMDEIRQTVNGAEDCVEQSAILYDQFRDLVDNVGEDADETSGIVEQAEQVVGKGQKQVKESLAMIGKKMMVVKELPSKEVRDKITSELQKLRTQVTKANQKLNPMVNVKQNFRQMTLARQSVQEVVELLTPAELESERAVKVCEPLKAGTWPSQETLKEAEVVLNSASQQLGAAMKVLGAKLRSASGTMRGELDKLNARGRAAERRLMELRSAHRQFHDRQASASLVADVAEQVRIVQEAIRATEEVFSPLLIGGLSSEQVRAGVLTGGEKMKAAEEALSSARKLVSKRWVEAQRLSAHGGQEVKGKVEEANKQLQAIQKRIIELKNATKSHKETAARTEPTSRVEGVETIAQQITAIGELLSDPERLATVTPKQIQEDAAALRAHQAEILDAMKAAQQLLIARQIEAKKKNEQDEVDDMAKLQERLRAAQAAAAQFKVLPPVAEKHIEQHRQIEEATASITEVEGRLERAVREIHSLKPRLAIQDGSVGGGSGPECSVTVEVASSSANVAAASMKDLTRFLEVQVKAKGVPAKELEKLQSRVKAGQDRLDKAMQTLTAESDRRTADQLIEETYNQVRSAEAAVERVCNMSGPLLEGEGSSQGGQDKIKLFAVFRSAGLSAKSELTSAKSALMTRLAKAKRLSGEASRRVTDELTAVQSSIEEGKKRLEDVQREASSRAYAAAKAEVGARVNAAEQMVKLAVQAVDELTERNSGKETVEARDLQEVLSRGSKLQENAQAGLAEINKVVQGYLSDLDIGESPTKDEFKALLTKVTSLQAQLDKQKKAFQEHEQTFVARELIKVASPMVEDLEAKMDKLNTVAAPFLSDAGKSEFAAVVSLSRAMEALSMHAKTRSVTKEAIFDEVRAGENAVSEARFVSYVHGLPELKESDDPPLTVAELRSAYANLDSVGGGQVALRQFLDQMRERYICVRSLAMTEGRQAEGSRHLRTLEPNELVEALEEPPSPTSSASCFSVRLKARAEKDSLEGFVTLSGEQGQTFLERFSPQQLSAKQIDEALEATASAIKSTMGFLTQKQAELKSARGNGPLGEVESDLMKLRARGAKAQAGHTVAKRRITEARQERAKRAEAQKKVRMEAERQAAAAAALGEATELIERVSTEAEKASAAAAQALRASAGQASDKNARQKAFEGVEQTVRGVQDSLTALASAKESVSQTKASASGQNLAQLQRLISKVSSLESRCRQQAKALDAARRKLAAEAEQAVAEALRVHCRKFNVEAGALFKQLSKAGPVVPVAQLQSLLESNGDLQATELDLGFKRHAQGVSRFALVEMVQDYRKCVKELVLTTSFEVKSGSVLRKLELGEIVEILGEHGRDPSAGLERARGRALRDSTEGWVTLRGNQGTAFFEPTAKPYLWCHGGSAVPLKAACEMQSKTVTTVLVGDVLEVLEGPKAEPPIEVRRVRGRAKKDGKTGWVTLQERADTEPSLKQASFLQCRAGIALTADFSLEADVIRKLEVGELLEALGESREEEERKVTRIRVRAEADGKEGWATSKGSEGTVYIAESTAHYVCCSEVPIERSLPSKSGLVRQCEVGEVFEVLEGPVIDSTPGAMLVRCRVLHSSEEGWAAAGASGLAQWVPRLRCARRSDLRASASASASEGVVRPLEEGEIVEALSTPMLQSGTEALCIQVRAEHDGTVGFVSAFAGEAGSSSSEDGPILQPIQRADGS